MLAKGTTDGGGGGSNEALRQSMQHYRLLFEQSIDGIYLHALDGKIIDVNRAALKQSGFTKDELLRMTVFDSMVEPRPSRDTIVKEWRQWPLGSSFVIETSHRRKDGAVYPVEVNTGKVLIGQQELMLAIVRDCTERKLAEERRTELERQLRHAQKMEAIGRLAGGVAHDFNNLLCAIGGNAELALDEAVGEEQKELIEAVIESASRATDLTRQLLAFSRKQVAIPQVVNLSDLIKTLHPMLVRLLGEDVLLRTDARARGNIRVDPAQIEQVVVNLAINARDAMPSGGDLLLETSDLDFDEDECCPLLPGSCVLLAITDTGAGMDAETRAQIFDPFFTTKETGKGTGLGLATVHGIVAQSGGQIEVQSDPGKGTTFKLYFPRVLEPAEVLARPNPPTAPRGEETILVVEDDEAVRKIAVRVLERCGYEVLSAESGADALQLAASREGSIDLLFTDGVMPGMSGRELAIRLAALRPEIKTLFTSGYAEKVIVNDGVVDRGLWFLAKPYTVGTLATRVREVLDDSG